jgi:hypothetical protein
MFKPLKLITMANVFVKILRYIIFLLICILAIWIIYWAFGHLLIWFLGLSIFWLIVILILFGSAIWGLFKFLSSILMYLVSRISPNRVLGAYTILILSIISGIWVIYNSWTLDIKYSGNVIFVAIVFTILALELTYALYYGSVKALVEDE